jgi:Holliday junction DNA helicase RuvB
MGARLIVSSGPTLDAVSDLAGILTKMRRGEVLFIDEVHRIRKHVAEFLYSAMEDFRIELALDEGPYARAVSVPLQRFTLIGATTRSGLLPKPFRDRMGIQERLEPYGPEELQEIVRRSAAVLGVGVDEEASELIAVRARGTPRLANRYLSRVRDVARARGQGRVTRALAEEGLDMLGVDREGLDAIDRRLLAILAETPSQPVGLKTLAVALGEEEDTIEDVYEPYLIVRGFVRKTARGRILGPRGCALLGVELPPATVGGGGPAQGALFA